jgi:hypothetical protein
MGFGVVIGFTEHLQNITTNNNDSLTELHTPKITVTTAYIKFSQFAIPSPAVAWLTDLNSVLCFHAHISAEWQLACNYQLPYQDSDSPLTALVI